MAAANDEECILMTEDHRAQLTKHLLALMAGMRLSTWVWAHLQCKGLITDTDVQRIKVAQKADDDKVYELIEIMKRRPDRCFKEFVNILRETDQPHLAQLFDISDKPTSSHTEDVANAVIELLVQKGYFEHSTDCKIGNTAQSMQDPHLTKIPSTTLDFYKRNRQNSYDHAGIDKGRVLLINVSQYRPGADVDKCMMRDLFQDLGYSVEILDDPSFEETDEAVYRFALSEANADTRSVFVVIMAHGGMDRNRPYIITSCGGKYYYENQFEDYFSTEKAPHLYNKPKVFIIQASRGAMVDTGACIEIFDMFPEKMGEPGRATLFEGGESFAGRQTNSRDLSASAVSPEKPKLTSETYQLPTKERICSIAPCFVDSLFAFATRPGYKAARDVKTGSLFLCEINEVFRREAATTHVADMLTMVRQNLVFKTSKATEELIRTTDITTNVKQYVQTTESKDSLTKRFFIFPGI